jgi:hypothetical protein
MSYERHPSDALRITTLSFKWIAVSLSESPESPLIFFPQCFSLFLFVSRCVYFFSSPSDTRVYPPHTYKERSAREHISSRPSEIPPTRGPTLMSLSAELLASHSPLGLNFTELTACTYTRQH